MTIFEQIGLYFPPMNESIGTIQVGHPEIKKFIIDIANRIINQDFKKYEVDELSSGLYRNQYRGYKNTHHIYVMRYSSTIIPWIDSFDVLVVIPKDKTEMTDELSLSDLIRMNIDVNEIDFKAASFIEDTSITKFSINDTLKHGAIILNNPQKLTQLDLLGAIFHEMNHYYSAFRNFINIKNKWSVDDLAKNGVFNVDKFDISKYMEKHHPELIYYNSHSDDAEQKVMLMFNKKYCDDIMNNLNVSGYAVKEIKSIFISLCYYLSAYEINAIKENIFIGFIEYYEHNKELPRSLSDKELLKYNKYLANYLEIEKLLNYMKVNISFDIVELFNKKHSYEFGNIIFNKEGDSDEFFSGNFDNNLKFYEIIKIFKKRLRFIGKNLKKMLFYVPQMCE